MKQPRQRENLPGCEDEQVVHCPLGIEPAAAFHSTSVMRPSTSHTFA
jgi:hypothetical protein